MPTLSPQTTPYYGGGQVVAPPDTFRVTGAPSVKDIHHPLGTLAIDNSAAIIYGLASLSGGTATWAILGGATGAVATMTGDTGTATPSAGNIKLAGTANQITTAASGATITLSLPSSITTPGSLSTTTTLSATTTVTGGTGVTATTGNISASAGNVQATGNLIASKSAAGATVSGQITNSDNSNTASHAQLQISVGGTSGGNPSLLWQVSGTSADDWAAGPDRANSYRWCLSDGDVVGTTDRLRVAHTTGNVEVVSGTLSTSSGSITSATTLTATSGAVTATNGNFVGSTAGTGLQFNANTNSGVASGAVILNSRAGRVVFTSVSIAGGADLTLTMTNSAITSSSTQIIHSIDGATTGAALSVKSITPGSGTVAFVITNGTGATTTTADIGITFLVVN